MKNFNAKELVKELTMDELLALNTEALKNFKEGNEVLLAERRKRCTNGIYDDRCVQQLGEELIVEILETSCSSIWEGIGLSRTALDVFYCRHED